MTTTKSCPAKLVFTSINGRTYAMRERRKSGAFYINSEYVCEVVARNGRVLYVATSAASADAAYERALDFVMRWAFRRTDR